MDQSYQSIRIPTALALTAGAILMLGVVASAFASSAQTCMFKPMSDDDKPFGLVVGADILLPEGKMEDYGIHIRFNGSIGAVAKFDELQADYPDSAVLDCRGNAVLSPGFVNAHEHPAYSYAFPDKNLNPNYLHRDEWRLGVNDKASLPIPKRYEFQPNDSKQSAALVSMELRHLIGGTTTIAGSGGVPGVIRNVNLHKRLGDSELYDAEVESATFPFSFRAVEELKEECSTGTPKNLPLRIDSNLNFMAYIPHVGEGRYSSCTARAEVTRYLQHVQLRDRRYSLIHGIATDVSDYVLMQNYDVTLVWSPRSNLALYGETIDIASALEQGVKIALSTDWSPSGSFNMREEVKCAKHAAIEAGIEISSEMLWQMSTINGAYALGLEDRFGKIKSGLPADLILVQHKEGDPYDSVLTATHEDILAAWVNGQVILLSEMLDDRLSNQQCLILDGVSPRVCGVLEKFNLSEMEFQNSVKDIVPLVDTTRQAPCEVPG